MNKIEKAFEEAKEILDKNDVNYVLMCKPDNNHILGIINCTPNDALKILCHLAAELAIKVREKNIPAIIIADRILGAVMKGLSAGNNEKKVKNDEEK